MLDWILPPFAFSYAFHQVEPTKIVDGLIEIAVKILTPGRGAGKSNWWMKGLRKIEEHAEKMEREIDIRSDLRRWDNEFPYMHHELVVRYAAGFLASSMVGALCYTFSQAWRSIVHGTSSSSSRRRL